MFSHKEKHWDPEVHQQRRMFGIHFEVLTDYVTCKLVARWVVQFLFHNHCLNKRQSSRICIFENIVLFALHVRKIIRTTNLISNIYWKQ